VTTRRDILLGCLCAFGSEAIFGVGYVCAKAAVSRVDALALLGWRFAVAAAAMGMLAAAGVIRVRLRGKPLRRLAAVGALTVLYYAFETAGIARTTASESGALLACIPVAALAASALILRKKPTRRQTAGIFTTLAGVLASVFAAGATASFSASGYAFLAAAAATYALYCVAVDVAARDFTGAEITMAMLAALATVFAPLAVVAAAMQGGCGAVAALARLPFEARGFAVPLLWLGLASSIGGFFLANTALSKAGVNRTASFIGVATLVAVLAGAAFLGETFTAAQAVAAVLIVAGVWIANGGRGE
jgi:drug/metabolite transporter (DMT)-like permease